MAIPAQFLEVLDTNGASPPPAGQARFSSIAGQPTYSGPEGQPQVLTALSGVYPLVDTYGVVNDAPALNAAITAVSSAAHPGGVVWIPPGTHRLKSTVTNAAGVRLAGAGASVTNLLVDDTGGNIGDAIVFSNIYRPAICDLTITATALRTAGNAIHVTGGDPSRTLSPTYPLSASAATIERVDMDSQFNGLLVDNNTPHSQWLLYVDNGVWSNFNGGSGLWLNANTAPGDPGFGASHFISRLFFYNNLDATFVQGNGIRVQGSGDFNIRECETFGFNHGLLMDSPSDGFVTTGRFQNCYFDVSGNSTAEISPDPASVFYDIAFDGCWFASSEAAHGLYLNSSKAGDVRCVNCIFLGNNIFGLVIAAGCTGFQADACTFAGNVDGGVIATQSATDWAIRNSKFNGTVYNNVGTQPVGVQIDVGCVRYIVVNNNMHFNTTPILDNGGAVSKIVSPNLT